MGYGGKIAIHPDQVAIIHEVFTPSAQEVDWAKKRDRHLRKQSRRGRADARRQDARQAAPRAGAPPDGARRMREKRLAPADTRPAVRGPRDSVLTIRSFLEGLETAPTPSSSRRSTCPTACRPAFRCCRPSPACRWCCWSRSTSSADQRPGYPSSSAAVPCRAAGCRTSWPAASAGLEWIENAIHPALHWWVTRHAAQADAVAWALLIVLLALPIPFDNLFPPGRSCSSAWR